MSMFNKIVEYASRQLEIPAEEITRDTTFESLGLDLSLIHISLYLPVPYSWYERMKLEVAAFDGLIRDTQFGADVELEVLLPEAQTTPFLDRLRDLSGATLEALVTGQEYRAFPLAETSAIP